MSNIRALVLDALLVALLIVCKEALAFIANVEIVTLLLIIFAIHLSLRDLGLIAVVFATVENLMYGFNIYSISYYMVWLIIVFVTYSIKNNLSNEYRVAFLALLFGLFFDFPFSIPYFLLDINSGIAYLMAGLVFSLVHGIANFIIALLLFNPLDKAFFKLCKLK